VASLIQYIHTHLRPVVLPLGHLRLMHHLPERCLVPDGDFVVQVRVEPLPPRADGLCEKVVGRLARPEELASALPAGIFMLAPIEELPPLSIRRNVRHVERPLFSRRCARIARGSDTPRAPRYRRDRALA